MIANIITAARVTTACQKGAAVDIETAILLMAALVGLITALVSLLAELLKQLPSKRKDK